MTPENYAPHPAVESVESEPDRVFLSPAGLRRRELILRSSQEALVMRRRRRRRTRLLACGVVAAGLVGWVLQAQAPSPDAPSVATDARRVWRPAYFAQLTAVDARTIEGDPQVHRESVVPSRAVSEETFVDDDELLSLLAEAGIAAGVARVEGKTRVIFSAESLSR